MNNTAVPDERGRAWIEINLDSLAHNLADIRSKLPENCEVMAIVKANAYGHGVEKIAKRLAGEGVRAFAVATVVEGIQLRRYIPGVEILVLGCTRSRDAQFLHDNDLTQLVVDEIHAKALDSSGYALNVHVAIDTGMHRLGIEPSNIDEIEKIFNYENLNVKGVATHFASSDSLIEDDIDFTNLQMEKFLSVIETLRKKGHDVGKLHTQSSYGIYNHPGFKCDYVRPGIMMYGVQSKKEKTVMETGLHPVLSLKALVAQVRWIKAGESVSYGRTYVADKPVKLATISIGYADGIPRQISGNGGMCIIKGKKVPITGRVCMDMLMADVTDIEDVQAGDEATLIGRDGNEEIRSEEVAETAGTITNDLLAGLGNRLPRIYV